MLGFKKISYENIYFIIRIEKVVRVISQLKILEILKYFNI